MPLREAMDRPAENITEALFRPTVPAPLDFDVFRRANVRRCIESFHAGNGLDDWSPTDWGNAMAGECGEACNLIKKLRRLGPTPETIPEVDTAWGREVMRDFREAIGKELADVVTYADLLAARLGIDLGEAVRQKFNEVSARVKSPVVI